MPITTRSTCASHDLARIGLDLAVPRTAVVEARGMEDPAIDVDVHVEVLDGVLVPQRVDVRSAGSPVTTEVLRSVPVAALVRHLVALVGRVVSVDEDGRMVVEDGVVPDDEDVEHVRTHGEEDSALRIVATVYALGRAMGRPPALLVEEWLHLTRSTAARRIRGARARGLLPASEGPGRLGPVRRTSGTATARTSATAVVKRGADEDGASQVGGHGE